MVLTQGDAQVEQRGTLGRQFAQKIFVQGTS